MIAPIQGGTRASYLERHRSQILDIDSYAMAAASVDEALRNAVCVGWT